jgi:hypothetical protein
MLFQNFSLHLSLSTFNLPSSKTGVDNDGLLGCGSVWIVGKHQRFEGTCCLHSALKMEALCYTETLVSNYNTKYIKTVQSTIL